MERTKDEIERIEQRRAGVAAGRRRSRASSASTSPSRPPGSTRRPRSSDFDFLEKVGFPGQYPFTAGNQPFAPWRALAEAGAKLSVRPDYGASSAGRYSGYGTAEDYRDYLLAMQARGSRGGPNVAFDLVTQCGYDSDSPRALGEVGRVGVAIDSYRDFRVIYEAFTGERDIDKVASNFTINAPCAVILAMLAALAEERGIPLAKLRGTPQNDILKEFIARGTYIYPPRESMRLFRDTLVFCRQHMPSMNVNSIGGYHIREAGATRVQDLAFSLANGIAYLKEGVRRRTRGRRLRLDVHLQRLRRKHAGLPRDRLPARRPPNVGAHPEGALRRDRTARDDDPAADHGTHRLHEHDPAAAPQQHRPIRGRRHGGGHVRRHAVRIPALRRAPRTRPQPRGSIQLQLDATRIMIYEAGVGDVADPWAGSYFMESLTDEIEAAAQEELDRIEDMGGAVARHRERLHAESRGPERLRATEAHREPGRLRGGRQLLHRGERAGSLDESGGTRSSTTPSTCAPRRSASSRSSRS